MCTSSLSSQLITCTIAAPAQRLVLRVNQTTTSLKEVQGAAVSKRSGFLSHLGSRAEHPRQALLLQLPVRFLIKGSDKPMLRTVTRRTFQGRPHTTQHKEGAAPQRAGRRGAAGSRSSTRSRSAERRETRNSQAGRAPLQPPPL